MGILTEARRTLQDAIAKVTRVDSDSLLRLTPESDLRGGLRKCEAAAINFELVVHLVARRTKLPWHPKMHSR